MAPSPKSAVAAVAMASDTSGDTSCPTPKTMALGAEAVMDMAGVGGAEARSTSCCRWRAIDTLRNEDVRNRQIDCDREVEVPSGCAAALS